MEDVLYSPESISIDDLRIFSRIAIDVLYSSSYGAEFIKHLATIALCQGAANHYAVTHGYASRYLDPQKNGVKDIDIWYFFKKIKSKLFHPMWKQHRDLGISKFGKSPSDHGYLGRRIDFFGRSIPLYDEESIDKAICNWLRNGKCKSSAHYLYQKAVVGLYPDSCLGKIIWLNPMLI